MTQSYFVKCIRYSVIISILFWKHVIAFLLFFWRPMYLLPVSSALTAASFPQLFHADCGSSWNGSPAALLSEAATTSRSLRALSLHDSRVSTVTHTHYMKAKHYEFSHTGYILEDIFSPGVLMLPPAALTKEPTKTDERCDNGAPWHIPAFQNPYLIPDKRTSCRLEQKQINKMLHTVDIAWCRRLLPLAVFKKAVRCGSCGLSASSHRPPLGSGCWDTSTVRERPSWTRPTGCLSADYFTWTDCHTNSRYEVGWAPHPTLGPSPSPAAHAVLSYADRASRQISFKNMGSLDRLLDRSSLKRAE